MGKLYNVGIYARLSVDDANNSNKVHYNCLSDNESGSIENQKAILSKFAMLNGWIETKVYSDDGYSGSDFQRPGFTQMLEDAKNGIINLILVKDLSRLGRDYIEVGRYVDIIFPSLGCRFVSLLDEVDTSKEDNDMMHFRNLMNDYLLKDLSIKIKSALISKARSGQFLSAYAPYGYRKHPDDKHKLIIDEYASEIIRRIFDMRLQGVSYYKITAILNSEGILAPRAYWQKTYGSEGQKSKSLWTYKSVKTILKNEIYIGTLILNRTGTLSHKSKSHIEKPKELWFCHTNSHAPIISKDTWDKVQEINCAVADTFKNSRKPVPALFVKKLFCMSCGSPMAIISEIAKKGSEVRYNRYICNQNLRCGKSTCSPHAISETVLKKLILTELKSHVVMIDLDEQNAVNKIKQMLSVDSTEYQEFIQKERKHLAKRMSELNRINSDLYEDKVHGKISESTFIALIDKNEQERQRNEGRYNELEKQIAAFQEKLLDISKWSAVIRKHANLTDIQRVDIEELIERIEIGESDYSSGTRQQEVKIHWSFVGCLDS